MPAAPGIPKWYLTHVHSGLILLNFIIRMVGWFSYKARLRENYLIRIGWLTILSLKHLTAIIFIELWAKICSKPLPFSILAWGLKNGAIKGAT